MTVIIASHAAHLNGGEPDTRTFQVLPRHRLRLAITEHTGRTSALFGADAFSRVQGFGGRQTTTGHRAPIKFSRRQGPGSLLPFGNARFKCVQQSSRVITDPSHRSNSFRDAPASELQEITGGVGNVRKAFGEIQNVEC